MAALEKDWDDANDKKDAGSPDPETLYTKEYCIGLSHACFCSRRRGGARAWMPRAQLSSCCAEH